MKLFKRDFKTLTAVERDRWRKLRDAEVANPKSTCEIRTSNFRKYPKAARHYISLFPNQYLDVLELDDTSRLTDLLDEFEALLDQGDTGEREILNFINQKRAYFVVGGICKRRLTSVAPGGRKTRRPWYQFGS